jgi:putative spermidine/putrescine transport system ATP-binding protein
MGRIEQIGAPAAIYEHPATVFVAGFVGASNVCSGELAQRLSGTPRAFAIRPEKITLAPAADLVPDGWLSASGVVRAITYHGATTRYAVSVEGGGEISVMRQNSSDGRPAASVGEAVRISWPRNLVQPLAERA